MCQTVGSLSSRVVANTCQSRSYDVRYEYSWRLTDDDLLSFVRFGENTFCKIRVLSKATKPKNDTMTINENYI